MYVVDGKVWTSAGVTTGIDMALAMVEAGRRRRHANAIARRLVLYARRPGYQSQFSPLLNARIQADSPFADLIDWMQNNLDKTLDAPTLAARAGLGERNFYRRFLASTGSSPAHFVEALRLEAARTLVDGDLPLKGVAARWPQAPIRLNHAFERRFGVAPRLFRDMHRSKPMPPLVDRMSGHRGKFAHQAVGHLARHRQLARVLELRDRSLGIGADGAGRLQLAVARLGQRALHRCDTSRTRGLRSLRNRCRRTQHISGRLRRCTRGSI